MTDGGRHGFCGRDGGPRQPPSGWPVMPFVSARLAYVHLPIMLTVVGNSLRYTGLPPLVLANRRESGSLPSARCLTGLLGKSLRAKPLQSRSISMEPGPAAGWRASPHPCHSPTKTVFGRIVPVYFCEHFGVFFGQWLLDIQAVLCYFLGNAGQGARRHGHRTAP